MFLNRMNGGSMSPNMNVMNTGYGPGQSLGLTTSRIPFKNRRQNIGPNPVTNKSWHDISGVRPGREIVPYTGGNSGGGRPAGGFGRSKGPMGAKIGGGIMGGRGMRDTIGSQFGKAVDWGGGTNFMGRNFANGVGGRMTYGRAGLVGGLGLLAASNAAKAVDRARYGDYGGAMLNTAMTGAAGAGAYAAYRYKGAFSTMFKNGAAKLLGQLR